MPLTFVSRGHIDMQEETKRKFELAGSKPHYAPSLLFTISHMRLEIEPDLKEHTILCYQELDIVAIQDTDSIEMDVSELDVRSIAFGGKKVTFRNMDNRLVINLPKPFAEGQQAKLAISYSAKPRKGFYFVAPDQHYPNRRIEAWTQGETVEAKHWFPCIDHPQVKFSSETIVTVPEDFTVISNGRLENIEKDKVRKKWKYYWIERNPHPAYLTSLVVGKYIEINEGSLYYYVPTELAHDAKRSFDKTGDMMQFFEEYLNTKYPYEKYSQVCVQDFVFGGMENSSCTTLTQDTLHDRKAHVDFTSDYLVSHELAHQWFGDLVTCRDWQHIWLNEGFATYCEALYWEASRGIDEFHYYVMQTADDYFDEAASRYMRPIVTKTYKHPDDLFDRHTYEKGGCVLHMLRNLVGDKYFRRSLKTYLQRFANSTAETDDLRKVFELETGKSLQQFFDQWVFREGHPELKVEFSHDDKKMVKIRVEQAQQQQRQQEPFTFPLEIKLAFTRGGGYKTFTFNVSDKESIFQLPLEREIEWFSIDPEFKVLKTLSIKAPKEMLVKQLQNGQTIVERIEAARALKEHSADAVVDALQKAVINDKFWGVAVESAKSLGTIRTDHAYRALEKCLRVSHPKARRAVVKALGEFKRPESIAVLKSHLQEESYFVESEAVAAIGKTKSTDAVPILKKAIETVSFQNVVAQGAILGLKEFPDDKEIASLLVEKSKQGNHHRVREAATFALAKFVDGGNSNVVVDQLKLLLTDSWFRVRINACRAFADAEYIKAIPDLTRVSGMDLDHRVRRVAEECINLIRDAAKKPKEISQMRDELDKIKAKNLEIMQKMDRLERGLR